MGLDEYEVLHSLFCYPNPSSDVIHILVNAERQENEEIAIYDMMGRRVFVQSCQLWEGENSFIINPSLPSGMYVLRIGRYTQRIMRY